MKTIECLFLLSLAFDVIINDFPYNHILQIQFSIKQFAELDVHTHLLIIKGLHVTQFLE